METYQPRQAIRSIVALTLGALLVSPSAEAAQLKPETLDAWAAYISATEHRIEREHASNAGFLVQDFDDDADRGRNAVRRGEVPVRRMETRQDDGSKIKVRKGAIHHWRGSVFIPGVTLGDVIDGVKSPLRQEDLQEDVLESRVLEQNDDRMKVFLKLRRKKFITVHYNTEHEMRYTRHDGTRASSRSIATKIAELKSAGTPLEEEKPAGNDRGFLWRLNSYWRYAEVDGGVIVECESVSLSRSIPAAVRWMVTPLIRSAARESMTRTLTSMRARLLADVDTTPVADAQ